MTLLEASCSDGLYSFTAACPEPGTLALFALAALLFASKTSRAWRQKPCG